MKPAPLFLFPLLPAFPLLLLLLSAALPPLHAADESIEPPLNHTLKIGDQSYPVADGVPFDIGEGDAKTTGLLTTGKLRVFPYQDLEFKYPGYFTFEASVDDPTNYNWTLSGTDCSIMVLLFQGTVTPAEFAEVMAGQFGKENTTIRGASLTLGGSGYLGATADALVAGNRQTMDIVALTAPEGMTKLLVVQDSINENNEHTVEYAKVLKVLNETFTEKKDDPAPASAPETPTPAPTPGPAVPVPADPESGPSPAPAAGPAAAPAPAEPVPVTPAAAP